jgi:Na+-transporting methylmalonyl-CoA/oxaloacetate decarboxylase gamma subunit
MTEPVALSLMNTLTAAAPQGRYEAFREGLELTVVGLFIVFFALVVIGALLVILNRPSEEELDQERAERKRQRKAAAAPAPAPVAGQSVKGKAVDPRTVAILTAAAYAALGKPVRVRQVQRIGHVRRGGEAWARQGRREIQSSHNLAKRGFK